MTPKWSGEYRLRQHGSRLPVLLAIVFIVIIAFFGITIAKKYAGNRTSQKPQTAPLLKQK